MAQGLPVICLSAGGPAAVAGADAAMIVDTASRGEADVIGALADAVAQLMASPTLHSEKSAAALGRARAMTWSMVVSGLWPAQELGEI